MKTNITTFALMAIITSSAFAALKAPMPEFKNDKQLAESRAGKASQATSQGYAKEEPAFYTGKPFIASSGNYAFKYRSYDPEMARWTSEDPSGFPDGANQVKYCPTPTTELDFEGLLTFTGMKDKPADTTVPFEGHNYTISSSKAAYVNGVALTGNFNISTYETHDFGSNGGVNIWIDIVNAPDEPFFTDYQWKQTITTNQPLGAGHASGTPYNDAPPGKDYYSQGGNAADFYFNDTPQRAYKLATKNNPITWTATLNYLGHNRVTGSETIYGTLTYNFTITE